MKKFISLTLSCLLSLSLCACGKDAPAKATGPASPTLSATQPTATATQAPAAAAMPPQTNASASGQNFSISAPSSQSQAYYDGLDPNSPALLAYDAVMHGNKKFVDTQTGNSLSISRMLQTRSTGEPVIIRQMTITDLGREGTPEVILWLASGTDQTFGFEVLRYDGGEVYGYELTYRCFDQLKTDGSYKITDGTGYGYGTMVFHGPTCSSQLEASSSPDADAAHAAKADVIWFPDWMEMLHPNYESWTPMEGVMSGSAAMTDPATQKTLTLENIGTLLAPEEVPTHVRQLAVLDLDQDGIEEVVLQIATDYDDFLGCVILRYENGSVHADGYYHRPFHDLKADGTYRSSGSSSDCSYGRKTFVNGQWVETILAQRYATVQEGGGQVLVYFINGVYSDEASFAAFEAQQAAKPAVTWYDSWASYAATRHS